MSSYFSQEEIGNLPTLLLHMLFVIYASIACNNIDC